MSNISIQVKRNRTTIIEVGQQGPTGPQGPQGIPGSTTVDYDSVINALGYVPEKEIKVAFGYGDATPKIIANVTGRIRKAAIAILTPFNGAPSTLELGDASDPDRLIGATQNDPEIAAEYEATPLYNYATATDVLLRITLGSGVTQGSGIVILEF